MKGSVDFQSEGYVSAIIKVPLFLSRLFCSLEYLCWSEHFTAWTGWTGPWAECQPASFQWASTGTLCSAVNCSPTATPASADFCFTVTITPTTGIVSLLSLLILPP